MNNARSLSTRAKRLPSGRWEIRHASGRKRSEDEDDDEYEGFLLPQTMRDVTDDVCQPSDDAGPDPEVFPWGPLEAGRAH
jgi:hypothetical protein